MSTLKVNEIDSKTGTTITVAAGKTIAGTDIIDTAQIAADAITAAEIEAGAVGATEIANTIDLSSKSVTLAAGEVSAGELAATLDLSSKTVTVPAVTVTTHVTAYDDSKLRNDIATLALHSAIADNKAAYNLTNSFLDQFQDDTGIDAETTCDRSTSEYMSSITGDANTLLLLHCNGANDGSTFTNSCTSGVTATAQGHIHTDTGEKKFGTASAQFDGTGDYLSLSESDLFEHGTDDFTYEAWLKTGQSARALFENKGPTSGTANGFAIFLGDVVSGTSGKIELYNNSTLQASGGSANTNSWVHFACVNDSGTIRTYVGGVQVASATNNVSWGLGVGDNDIAIGRDGEMVQNGGGTGRDMNGYMDEIRISDICRYPDGTTFSVQTEEHPDGGTTNAAGNFTSATQTAQGTVSKMSIVVLYKNNAGTATLDTDLVAQVSSNGGTNYTSAPLTAAGTFSTGILMAKSNDITISNTSTAPKYKISFANQASGSKETQVHGVALLY